MRTILFLLAIFLFSFSAKAADNNIMPPKLIAIENFGMGGPKFMFVIDDKGFINYYNGANTWYSPDNAPTKKPDFSRALTSDEHKKIIDLLNEINFWKWKDKYINYAVDDGLYWDISAKYGDKSMKAHGENGYPDSSGEMQPNKTAEYKKLIETLFSFTPYKNR